MIRISQREKLTTLSRKNWVEIVVYMSVGVINPHSEVSIF